MNHSIIDADGLLYQSAYNVRNVQEAYKKFIGKVQELTTMDFDQSGEFTLFLEDRGNWRKDIFPAYKAPRKKQQQVDPNAEMRWELGNFLKDNKLAIGAKGCETDDLVRWKAENMRKRGQPFTIISADKDLDMIPGDHIRFNPKWEITSYHVTEEEADYNYFKQIMIGDTTDNIKSPKLLGKKTAESLLAKTSPGNWRSMVEKEYRDRCGHEWKHALYFTGSLIHIQRAQDDFFQWGKGGTWWDNGFSGAPSCYNYTAIQLGA